MCSVLALGAWLRVSAAHAEERNEPTPTVFQEKRASSAGILRQLQALERRIDAQEQRLSEQANRLVDQDRRLGAQDGLLESQAMRLESQNHLLDAQAEIIAAQRRALESENERAVPDAALEQLAGRGAAPILDTSTPQSVVEPVGEPPEPDPLPEIPVLDDRGGVLTPPGVLTLEPELSSTTALQFEFDGVGLEEVVLIGDIQASSSDREAATSRMLARYGLRDRLELSLELPYVWRSERFERRIVTESEPNGLARRNQGEGFGDLALGLHYQLERSPGSSTTWIANLRLKSDTGSSPFEVDRDAAGIETELATGSGYWSVEPSVTLIAPTDPAVLYGTLSYAWNMPTRVGRVRRIGAQDVRVGRVDPGDALGIGFGIGVALNETTSFSLGYSHRYVLRSQTELNGRDFLSRPIHLGELQLGLSFEAAGSPMRLTTSIGVTEDAPDIRISLGLPVSWSIFD